jgi:GNAT superfamily N-acetyltransferase
VRIDPGATPQWLNGVTAANGVASSHRAIHDQIIKSIALPTAFATWTLGDRPAGFGMAVLDRGAVGLFDIVVHPQARGQGGGRTLTEAVMAWGRDNGATTAYLQVVDANAVARKLYVGMGFEDAYKYHYRRRDLHAPGV